MTMEWRLCVQCDYFLILQHRSKVTDWITRKLTRDDCALGANLSTFIYLCQLVETESNILLICFRIRFKYFITNIAVNLRGITHPMCRGQNRLWHVKRNGYIWDCMKVLVYPVMHRSQRVLHLSSDPGEEKLQTEFCLLLISISQRMI